MDSKVAERIAVALEGILQEIRLINSVSKKPPDQKPKPRKKTKQELEQEFYAKRERGEL